MKTTCLTIGSVRQRMTNDKCTNLAVCIVNGCSRQTVALLLLSSSMSFRTERQRLIEGNRPKNYITPFAQRVLCEMGCESTSGCLQCRDVHTTVPHPDPRTYVCYIRPGSVCVNDSSRSKFTSTLKLLNLYTTATICHHDFGHKGCAAIKFTFAFTLPV